MKPKVSIITVVYNGITEIENTILSVINQTYSNIEYLVIDGGSSDGTIDVIRKYESKIDYWQSEPDGGIYFAMNKGIELASGEWINFRNCGDYFNDKNTVEKIFSLPVADDIMILHGDCRFIDRNGYRDLQPSILRKSIKKEMPIFHPSAFVRTSLHKQFNFNIEYKSSADYEFVYRMISKGYKMEYRPILVATYNAIEGFSLTNWKIAKKEIWQWKYPSFPLKSFCIWLDIALYSLRKKIAKIRHSINVK